MSPRRDGPPRLARAILELLLPPRDPGSATGDLDEEYARYVRPERGRRGADAWYWRQVLLSLPRLLAGRIGAVRLPRGQATRYALRVLARRPGFALAAVSTLALGLGVNAAVFSVVDAVLLQPLPYHEPDRLVRPIPDELFFLDAHSAARFAERMTTLEGVAAWGRTLFLFEGDGGSEPEEVRGAVVSWNHFDMLGAAPMLGRTFVREDAEAQNTVVLSHGLWVRRFGADPGLVGRTVDISGRTTTVVGVMGPEHVPLEFDWQAWRPMPLDPEEMAGSGLVANGRLRDGVTLEEARTEMRAVLGELWSDEGPPSAEQRAGLRMVPLGEWLIGDVRPALVAVWGGVGFLLVLVCANLASLFLAHAGRREREFAVRSALGGSRMRITGQVLAEVAVVGALAAGLGLAAAAGALGWLVERLPDDLPRRTQIGLGGPALAYTMLAALAAAAVSGVAPAVRAVGGGGLAGPTHSGAAGSGGRGTRARGALVMVETAIAVVVVTGAALMGRSLASLVSVDPGFEAEGLATFRPAPPSSRYPVGPELEAYYVALGEALERVPGVTAVGAIQFLPMTPGGWWASYRTGDGEAAGAAEASTAMRVVRDGYFETMRLRTVEGRVLAREDFAVEGDAAAVVNEALVREAFGGGSAVGRTLVVQGGETRLRIVGVVGDVRQQDLRTESHAEVYVPFDRVPWRRMHMVARLDGDPRDALPHLRRAALSVDPAVALTGPMLMSDVVGRTLAHTRLVTALLAIFGATALALGAVGVYGVSAQAVAERRREIGLRIALGAGTVRVAGRTVLKVLVWVGLGLGVGLGGALTLGGRLEALLFGVGARDPWALAGAPAVLAAVALLSVALPALQAARTDPVETLRDD